MMQTNRNLYLSKPGTICGIAYSTTAGSFIVPRSTSDLQLITYAAPAGLTYSVENQTK